MTANRRYYQLVASLPALPYFRSARLMPMGRRRLEQRLALLHPDDLADLILAEDLVSWHRQPLSRTTEEIAAMYDQAICTIRNPALRDIVKIRMNVRTVMVALRLQRQGKRAPTGRWGVGPYTRMIESRWNEPEFGLAAIFPWIPEAREMLESGHAMSLEGSMLDRSWARLNRMADDYPFGFEQVFAFTFKWDILNRWLSYDATKARQRFEELILEVTRDHQDLFA